LEQEAINTFYNNFYSTYDVGTLTNYISDLINAWQVELISVGAAFVIGIIYLMLLRCCAGVMVWTTILAVIAVLGGGGYWVYEYRNNYATTNNTYKYLEYGAYAIWGIDGLFVLLVLCCCSRIRLAVAIMKVTG